jgi:hypothetical protein
MVRSVWRETVAPAFDVTVTSMVLSPVPEFGVTDAQPSPLPATHEQLGPLAWTPTDPTDPADGPYGLARPLVSIVTLHAMPS